MLLDCTQYSPSSPLLTLYAPCPLPFPRWTSAAPLPFECDLEDAAVLANQLLLRHMRCVHSPPGPDAVAFSLSSNSWSPLSGNLPSAWHGPSTVLDGRMYMLDQIGGIRLAVYDDVAQMWRSIGRLSPALLTPPCRILGFRGRLYVIGRGLSMVVVEVVEALRCDGKRRAVGNRTHRERCRISSCLAEHIAPVRRDPQRMLRDGRRPRGNSRRRCRPATTRRRVVFCANGDDRRLPRRQHEPRLKGHLRRRRCAKRRAVRRHDPRARRPFPRSLYPALHPLPLSPGRLPPNRASLSSSLLASPCLSIWFLPQTLPLQLQRICVASRSEAGVCAAAEHCHVLVSQAEEEREEPKAKGSDDSMAARELLCPALQPVHRPAQQPSASRPAALPSARPTAPAHRALLQPARRARQLACRALQPARRNLLPRASRPAAARASRPVASRVAPCCSPRVAPCCPARRALLQPSASRPAALPSARPAALSSTRPAALQPSASLPAALPSARPAALSSTRPAALQPMHPAALPLGPCALPCIPRHILPCRAAPPSPAEPSRAALPHLPSPPSRPATTTAAAASRATAAAGGGAAGAGAAGGAVGSAGGTAGAGGAGPATDQAATLSSSESAAALCASESAAAQGARESADALGASASTATGPASAEALHTFTLDSSASRCFFRDCTTVTPLAAPVPISLADPTRGPVVARASTVLPCPAVFFGSLSGLHLPAFSTNLLSNAVLQDVWVVTFIPRGQRVAICTCSRTGHHLATFTHKLGSGLYTMTTASAQVAESSQVAASSQTLLWHHCPGHPLLPRLRSMHSRLLVSCLPRSLPSLPRSLAPPCLPCVEGRQCTTPHSSEFPSTTAPLETLHMDVWGLAPISGTDQERYFLLVVDDYTRYTTVFPLRRKADVSGVLIPWIRATPHQLRERFRRDLPVLLLHSDRGGEFSSGLLEEFCQDKGICQTFTLSVPPQKNGIAEHRIGLIMEVYSGSNPWDLHETALVPRSTPAVTLCRPQRLTVVTPRRVRETCECNWLLPSKDKSHA
ncbi:unnamed protein product [Closterium sp. NIES-53]